MEQFHLKNPENAVCQYGNDYFPDAQLLQFQLEVFLLSKELLLPQHKSLWFFIIHFPKQWGILTPYVNFHLLKTQTSSFNLLYEKKPSNHLHWTQCLLV